MKCFLGIWIFLKRSLVFSILLFSSISLHWSLRKAFLPLLAVLWNSAFRWVYISFLFSLPFAFHLLLAICKASLDNHFAFFFLGGSLDHCFLPIQCHEPPSIVLQALLLDLISWIYLSLPLYNHKWFDLGHTWMVLWFSLLSSVKV